MYFEELPHLAILGRFGRPVRGVKLQGP
jgi:hypothetical protein